MFGISGSPLMLKLNWPDERGERPALLQRGQQRRTRRRVAALRRGDDQLRGGIPVCREGGDLADFALKVGDELK